ncbi:MAG: Trm112 family protein [Planctomycetota bacterium]
MIDADLVAMLRCPACGAELQIVPPEVIDSINRAISDGAARDVDDQKVSHLIETGLWPPDKGVVYPVRGGIPTLVVGEAIRWDSVS